MRYRQWKKNYKNQHGYNPGIDVDRRKQAKAANEEIHILSKALSQIDWDDVAKKIRNGISQLARAIGEAFNRAADAIHTE